MKALRRSLNKSDHHSSSSRPPPRVPDSIARPTATVAPPKKVIKALAPYKSTAPQELSFNKGDFFYVARDIQEGAGWYEAHNPVTNARGLVPREYFEEIQKGGPRTSTAIIPGPHNEPFSSAMTIKNQSPPPSPQSLNGKKPPGALYAVVQHDFVAERPDELDAKAGESILVIAQSNREWFVAKPIGRLGSAGLIPVSFVEVRDPTTGQRVDNVEEMIDRGDVPRVEEWKEQAAQYKAATISLGQLDLPSDSNVPNSPFAPTGPRTQPQYPFPNSPQPAASSSRSTLPNVKEELPQPPNSDLLQLLPPGLPFLAEVVAFHFEHDSYWFRVEATYQPDPSPPSTRLPPPIHLTLYRRYEDFYEFQIALLDEYPVQAGRVAEEGSIRPPDRILPFMPGPLSDVDDMISATRQGELDVYLRQLVALSPMYDNILRCPLVRDFFSPRPGDQMKEERREEVSTDDEEFDAVEQSMAGLSLQKSTSGDGGRSEPTRVASQSSEALSGLGHGKDLDPDRYMGNPYTAGGFITYEPPKLWSASRVAASPMISDTDKRLAYLRIKVFNARTDDLVAIRVHPRVTFLELMQKIRERLGYVTRVRYRGSTFVPGSGDMGTILENDEQMVEWFASGERLVLYAE